MMRALRNRVTISRRGFLQVGASSLAASLSPRAYCSEVFRKTDVEQSVICVYLRGGLSQVDSFDPKPNSKHRIFKAISTAIPGISFSELLPNLAKNAEQFSLLRSVTHSHTNHVIAEYCMRSGRQDAGADTPSFGAVLAHQSGWKLPPTYTAVPSTMADAGFLGTSCSAFNLLETDLLKKKSQADSNALTHNRKLLTKVGNGLSQKGLLSPTLQQRNEAYRRAWSILESDEMQSIVDLSSEPNKLRQTYGTTDEGDYLLLARRLAERGTRFVFVELTGWDMHTNIESNLKKKLPPVDQAIAALINDLQDRGLDKKIAVLVNTEFGRTPFIVPARAGRDHWANTMSLLIAGGGTESGRVIGKTDQEGGTVKERPITPEDLAQTLYKILNIDLNKPDLLPNGRRLLTEGAVIEELFS